MASRRVESYFPPDEKPALTADCHRRVQFDEVDSLRIVWHGRYVNYFEQGRNEWGRKYGFSYQDMVEHGFAMPIVQLFVDYLRPLRYDELILIRTRCHWTESAKLNMSYEIYGEDGALAARGCTVQVYTDLAGQPMLIRPEFAEEFYKNWDAWSAK